MDDRARLKVLVDEMMIPLTERMSQMLLDMYSKVLAIFPATMPDDQRLEMVKQMMQKQVDTIKAGMDMFNMDELARDVKEELEKNGE